MKKLLFVIIFFLGLTPSYDKGDIHVNMAQAVHAQQTGCPSVCGSGGGGGGFFSWLGGVFSSIGNAIGNAVAAVGNAIGNFFSGGGGDGEGMGNENGDSGGDDWMPDGDGGYVPDYGDGGGSFDPWNDPYFQNYGFNQDEWDILNNLGSFYDFYLNNSGGGTNNPPPCATSVTYTEDPTQKYGFDDYGTNAAVPWKSVEQNQSDKLKVTIAPATSYNTVFFNSADASKVTVSPATAPSAAFDLTATSASGLNKVDTEIQANCASATGPNISKFKVATYTLVTKTVMVRLVHSMGDGAGYAGYTSTDVSDATIIDYLDKQSYNQAVVKWTVVRKPALTIAFDDNKDGKINVDLASGWMNSEMTKIRDAAKDDSYDANLFIVSNPSDGSTGYMNHNQRYGYIHADVSSNPGNTVAHELGHGAFGFGHDTGDAKNMMYPSVVSVGARFRKYQWDLMH